LLDLNVVCFRSGEQTALPYMFAVRSE